MDRRFRPHDDGRAYRRAAFASLADRYQDQVAAALAILGPLRFEFPEVTKVHAEQLRPGLMFRHALPYCIAEDAYFEVDEWSGQVLAVLLAGHTLALSQLDYHLDGAPPDPAGAGATAQHVDLATAVAYAVRVIYAAGALAGDLPGGARLFRDVFDPVSGFVVMRMHRDSTERYSTPLLARAHLDLTEYLTAETSRLCASGYWEVMVRGPFARRGVTPPEELLAVVRLLRKLRQAVDEIADFDEDIRAGLITTPLLFALATAGDHRRITEQVRRLWLTCATSPTALDPDVLAGLRRDVTACGGFDRAARHAADLWSDGAARCERDLGPRGGGFRTLLDLKRAKLAELAPAAAP